MKGESPSLSTGIRKRQHRQDLLQASAPSGRKGAWTCKASFRCIQAARGECQIILTLKDRFLDVNPATLEFSGKIYIFFSLPEKKESLTLNSGLLLSDAELR
jgi:hypothetical protein